MCSLVGKIQFKLFETLNLVLLSGKLNRLIWSSPCGIFFFQLYFIGTLPLVAICIFITNLAFSLSIQYPLTQWIKGSFLATTNSTSGISFSPQLRFKEQSLLSSSFRENVRVHSYDGNYGNRGNSDEH